MKKRWAILVVIMISAFLVAGVLLPAQATVPTLINNRTGQYVTTTYEWWYKKGTSTTSRSWSRLSPSGSCKYSSENGHLLVGCAFAKSVVTYKMVFWGGRKVVGAWLARSPGPLYPCHTSTTVTYKRHHHTVILRAITSNPYGFAQCWLKRFKVEVKYTP
jgi:hypothetical protein